MPDRSHAAAASRHFLILALASAVIGAASPAVAQPTCGGTVGPGGTVTMTASIVGCTSDPALRVVGSVVLDMGGHVLTCDGVSPFVTGIAIEGKGATVRNGGVGGAGSRWSSAATAGTSSGT